MSDRWEWTAAQRRQHLYTLDAPVGFAGDVCVVGGRRRRRSEGLRVKQSAPQPSPLFSLPAAAAKPSQQQRQ